MVSEREFKRRLVYELESLFPGCIVLNNDASKIQGFPDILILYFSRWALLEVKKSIKAPNRPNQKYWVDVGNEMGYASFIYPENKSEVLDDIQKSFRT